MRRTQTSWSRKRLPTRPLHHRPLQVDLRRPANPEAARSPRYGPRRRTPPTHAFISRQKPHREGRPWVACNRDRHLLHVPISKERACVMLISTPKRFSHSSNHKTCSRKTLGPLHCDNRIYAWSTSRRCPPVGQAPSTHSAFNSLLKKRKNSRSCRVLRICMTGFREVSRQVSLVA